jgi:hypothetical protein
MPYHLDVLIFLRYNNKELWDAATVEECLKDPSGAAAVAEATALTAILFDLDIENEIYLKYIAIYLYYIFS